MLLKICFRFNEKNNAFSKRITFPNWAHLASVYNRSNTTHFKLFIVDVRANLRKHVHIEGTFSYRNKYDLYTFGQRWGETNSLIFHPIVPFPTQNKHNLRLRSPSRRWILALTLMMVSKGLTRSSKAVPVNVSINRSIYGPFQRSFCTPS